MITIVFGTTVEIPSNNVEFVYHVEIYVRYILGDLRMIIKLGGKIGR